MAKPKFNFSSGKKHSDWQSVDKDHGFKNRPRSQGRRGGRDGVDGLEEGGWNPLGDIGSWAKNMSGDAAKYAALMGLALVAADYLREYLTERITGRSMDEILESDKQGQKGSVQSNVDIKNDIETQKNIESHNGSKEGVLSKSIVSSDDLASIEGSGDHIAQLSKASGFRIPYYDRLSGLDRVDNASFIDEGSNGRVVSLGLSSENMDGLALRRHVTIGSNADAGFVAAGFESVEGDDLTRRSFVGAVNGGSIQIGDGGAVSLDGEAKSVFDAASVSMTNQSDLEKEIVRNAGNVDLVTRRDSEGVLSRDAKFVSEGGSDFGMIKISEGKIDFAKLNSDGVVLESQSFKDPMIRVDQNGKDNLPDGISEKIGDFSKDPSAFPTGLEPSKRGELLEAARADITDISGLSGNIGFKRRELASGVEF